MTLDFTCRVLCNNCGRYFRLIYWWTRCPNCGFAAETPKEKL